MMRVAAPEIKDREFVKPLLCGPGPCDMWPSVFEALTRPIVSPMCDELFHVLDDIRAGIQYIFQTRSKLVLALSGSGHSGMEAVIANLVGPGETLLIASRGIWDERALNIANRYGIKTVVTSVPMNETFTFAHLEEDLKRVRPTALFITHGDSSTGTVQKIEGLGQLCHKVVLGLPRYCSASAMFAHAHTDGFHTVLRRRIASLMYRVRGSTNTILRVLGDKHDCPLQRHWVRAHVHVPGVAQGGRYGALLLIDTVVSLAAEPFFMDEWEVDGVYTSTQKALSGPSGISPIAFSARAEQKIKKNTHQPPFYFDIKLLANQWNCYGDTRTYHHTLSPPLLWALRASLHEVSKETLSKSWARHAANTAYFHKRLQEQGFQFLVPRPEDRLVTVTTIVLPRGYDYKQFSKYMRDNYNILIFAGLGPTVGKALRIGIMGVNSRKQVVDDVVDAMVATLKALTKSSL